MLGTAHLHSGHAQLGLAGRQPRRGQAQLALVHGLLQQRHADLRLVVAHLQTKPKQTHVK